MLKEFREFLAKGNVIDLAVAVILGAAFNAIVTSLVDDLIMPVVGVLLGGIDFSSLAITVGDAQLRYGNFIQAVVNFLIVGFVLFMIIRTFNRMRRKEEEAPPAPSEEITLLTEIRDLLRDRRL